MPRESPFCIDLTGDERRTLEQRAAKYTSPYFEVVRAKVILLAAEGSENKEIGECLSLPRQIVSRWRKRFFDERLAGLDERPRRGRPRVFPPQIIMEVKALACELPKQRGLPFSRFSHQDIADEAVRCGIVASISGATVWRWLNADAIRPWCYRSWIWPRDPCFAQKAGHVLDLYHGVWEGRPLGKKDYVICCDEKTSIQARARLVPGLPPASHRLRRVEHEYERKGALAYVAAWDVHQAKLFGRCESTTGIEPFHRVVDLVMNQEPYRSATRVFWVTDNGSSHRGQTSASRLRRWYRNAILVHTPVHASWLNQVEIYFSILQRKVLTPNEFPDLTTLQTQIMDFQQRYESIAKPFEWKFTRADLKRVLARISPQLPLMKAVA